MATWDDSEYTAPDYNTYGNSGDAGGYDQIGNNDLQYNTMDTSNFWDQPSQMETDINQMGQNDLWSNLQQQNLNPVQMDNFASGLTSNGQAYDFSGGGNYQMPSGGMDWGQMGGKGLDALSSILKGGAGVLGQQAQGQNTNQMLKGLASLWGAQQEKKSQQQLGQSNQATAQQMLARQDPFAGERARYQQELAGVQDRLNTFRQNPTANTQYKTLQDQLISQANRGSRQRGTSDVQMAAALAPQLTKAQMDMEQQMIADRSGLYSPAGAGMSASQGNLAALLSANQNSAMGDSNASYASAIGRMLQGNQNTNTKTLSAEDIAQFRALAARLGQ